MKYKFLYDNLKANDIVEYEDEETIQFSKVQSVHCNCNSGYWKEHFHIEPYICEYDGMHSKRIRSIWRYENSNILKRVAKIHPRTRIWEINEDMLDEKPSMEKLEKVIKILQKYIQENNK